ncbi:MAG: MMPL family transporter [Bacilli bacterium]|nr:MMPL family transporter [Bacilli bacterium]
MKKEKILIKIGDFIAKFRYLFLSVFIFLFAFCLININNVKVNDDIVNYLPNDTETKKGLKIMEDEFGNYDTINLMINDISKEEAIKIQDKLSKIDNIKTVLFDKTEKTYKDNKALYTITLNDTKDKKVDKVKEDIEKELKDNDYNIYSEIFDDPTEGVDKVLILAVIVIIIILLITSKTYFEPVIAFIIFGISIVLNMGSNFLLGEISYITKSIAVILQLALSIDYVIIFMNQFMKEINDTSDTLLAIKKTLSKSIPEIFASSLTTVSGLMALVFMHLKIGGDIGIVLSKGIICSLLTVILLMPSLLYIFKKLIIKLKKKEKEIKLSKLSKFIVNKRKIILPIFIILVIISICEVPKYKYVYDNNSIKSVTLSENIKNKEKQEKEFGKSNTLIILLKNDNKDYQKELELTQKLKENNKITEVTSLGGYKIDENLYLGTSINYKELSHMFKVDEETSLNLYKYYAKENNCLEKLQNIDEYKITIIDLIYFLNNNKEILNDELKIVIDDYYNKINDSISLLESDNYSRFILKLNTEVEDKETSKLIDEIRKNSEQYYDDVILVGNSINAIDLKSSFTSDNIIITLITILFIFIILMFTFKSFGISILLILTIEGSILINFGIITLLDKNIFFMSYVVVSAIQMGATIDYAIVLADRYLQLRKKYDKKEALVKTLEDRLSAIITSGLILLIAGFLIGLISTSSVISSIGLFLGLGSLISLISTIFVLPAILYICDKFIAKTTLKCKEK